MAIAHISNTRHVMSVMYDTVATNICSLISKLLKGFISDNNYHATHLMKVEIISYTTMSKLWDSTKKHGFFKVKNTGIPAISVTQPSKLGIESSIIIKNWDTKQHGDLVSNLI